MIYFNFKKKSPLLAFIKFESTFLTGSLAVCLSAPVQGEAGGRGGGGDSLACPPRSRAPRGKFCATDLSNKAKRKSSYPQAV